MSTVNQSRMTFYSIHRPLAGKYINSVLTSLSWFIDDGFYSCAANCCFYFCDSRRQHHGRVFCISFRFYRDVFLNFTSRICRQKLWISIQVISHV